MYAVTGSVAGFEMRELNSEEINEISGAIAPIAAAAAIGAVAAMGTAVEALGEKIGKAIYHYMND